MAEETEPPLPLDLATQAKLREVLPRILASLTEREREVLKQRFGLSVDKTCSAEEVGRQFEVTRERLRRIEAKALSRLGKEPPPDGAA